MLEITENAVKEVKRIIAEQNMPETTVLRVGVQGGGCSGFSYSLNFDDVKETDPLNDVTTTVDGLTLVSNRLFEKYLSGTKIDYYQGLEKRGFVFDNPNATRSCGCGSSFSCG